MKIENIKIEDYLEVHKIHASKALYLMFDYLSAVIWRSHKRNYIIHIEISILSEDKSTIDEIIPITICAEPFPESEADKNNRPIYQFRYHYMKKPLGRLFVDGSNKYFAYNPKFYNNHDDITKDSSPYEIFNIINNDMFVRYLSRSFTYRSPNLGIIYSFQNLLKERYNFKNINEKEDQTINMNVSIIHEDEEVAFKDSVYKFIY